MFVTMTRTICRVNIFVAIDYTAFAKCECPGRSLIYFGVETFSDIMH